MQRYRSILACAVLLSASLSGATTKGPLTADEAEKTVQLRGPAKLVLSPGSALVRERSLRLELDGPAAGPIPVDVFRLTRGTVDVRFSTGGERRGVMIRAPRRLTIVSRMGHFRVVASESSSTVAAIAQDALVAVGMDWKPLAAGKARTIGEGASGEVRRILRAPAPNPDTALLVAIGQGADGHVKWAEVPGAQAYQVRLHRLDKSGASELAFQTTARRAPQVLKKLRPGTYRSEVAAVDKYGLASAASPTGTIRVIGVTLPKGARTSSGKIWLRPGQRAALSFTSGAEMTYGAASYFVPAPQSVGLFRNAPTRVRLRPAGGTMEAMLDLMPVSVSARVFLSPALPQWPRDQVRARIDYVAQGTTVPKTEPRVTLNGRPIPTKWRKHGSSMTAVIPKSRGQGPWVVRVEARDDRGSVIGRGFVEVVAGAATARKPSKRAAVAKR